MFLILDSRANFSSLRDFSTDSIRDLAKNTLINSKLGMPVRNINIGIVSKPVSKRVYKFTLFQNISGATRLVKSCNNNQLEILNDSKYL